MPRYNAIPDDWGRNEKDLWVEMIDRSGSGTGTKIDVNNDEMLRVLYDTALYNWDITPEERTAVREALSEYMWDNYELDFDDVFDWEGWREAYDTSQAS